MTKKRSPAEFLVIYKCERCGQDCGYTERQKPRCRFCGNRKNLTLISKQPITAEVMAARLKEVTDRMMASLISAYEELPKAPENIVEEGKDAETEMLKLMDKAKKLKDKVEALGKKRPPRTR
jgi:hypothetical protein